MASFGYLQRRGGGAREDRGRGMGQKGEGHHRKEGGAREGQGWDMRGEAV